MCNLWSCRMRNERHNIDKLLERNNFWLAPPAALLWSRQRLCRWSGSGKGTRLYIIHTRHHIDRPRWLFTRFRLELVDIIGVWPQSVRGSHSINQLQPASGSCIRVLPRIAILHDTRLFWNVKYNLGFFNSESLHRTFYKWPQPWQQI